MKRIQRNILIVISSLVLMLAFQNCSKAGIQVNDNGSIDDAQGIVKDDGPVPTPTPVPSVETEKASQSYSSSSQYKKLDMVWVVDNSASMTNNVTQTKRNISAFFSSLRQEMDINFTLITKEDDTNLNTSLKLSTYTNLGSQINFMVHSYNPMLVAAASTCPIIPAADDTFCNQVKANYRYNLVYGVLNAFFRADSLKVFVFVTDDDSAGMSGKSSMQYNKDGGGYVTEQKNVVENDDFITVDSFKKRMASAFGNTSSVKSFSFAALNSAADCKARVSTAYLNLASSTGGASFDICAPDWSANFGALTDNVIHFADTTYVVSDAKFVAVESVVLDGVVLVKNQDYTVNNNVVTLNSALVASLGSYSVVINYTRRVQ